MGALLAACIVALACYASVRICDRDELLHLNTASFVAQGERIYLDFFEYHPPLMAVTLQPVVRSSDDPGTIVAWGRAFAFGWTLALLAVVAALARQLAGNAGAVTAPLLLVSFSFFIDKTIEVRPDVPAALALMLALTVLIRGIPRASMGAWAGAGALLVIAGLFTPKFVYAAAGAVLGAVFTVTPAAGKTTAETRAAAVGSLIVGSSCVLTFVAGTMAWYGVLGAFVTEVIPKNLVLRVENPGHFRALYLSVLARESLAPTALGLAGLAWAARHHRAWPAGTAAVLVGSVGAGALGLFHIGAPMRQYYLSFLPGLSILGALAFVRAARFLRTRMGASWAILGVMAALAICLVPPAWALSSRFQSRDEQTRYMRSVISVTHPGERVFDCWTGLYLTRKPAFRYFFLLSDVIRVLEPERFEVDLLRALQDPEVTAAIIDRNFEILPASVRAYVRQAFVAEVDVPGLMVRRR